MLKKFSSDQLCETVSKLYHSFIVAIISFYKKNFQANHIIVALKMFVFRYVDWHFLRQIKNV